MSTPTTHRHTDIGAVALTGQVGSAVALFDARLLPLGWTKQTTPVGNVVIYENDPPSGPSVVVRITDNGSGTGGAREFSVEHGSSYDSGTDTFSAGTGALWHRKSSTLDATARGYLLVADHSTAHLFSHSIGDSDVFARDTSYSHLGAILHRDPANAYKGVTIGRTVQSQTNGGTQSAWNGANNQTTRSGIRAHDPAGLSGSSDCRLCNPATTSSQPSLGNTGPHSSIPDPSWLSTAPLIRIELGLGGAIGTIGQIRGAYQPTIKMWPDNAAAADLGDGLVFCPVACSTTGSDSVVGAIIIDTAGPWQ